MGNIPFNDSSERTIREEIKEKLKKINLFNFNDAQMAILNEFNTIKNKWEKKNWKKWIFHFLNKILFI